MLSDVCACVIFNRSVFLTAAAAAAGGGMNYLTRVACIVCPKHVYAITASMNRWIVWQTDTHLKHRGNITFCGTH